jgi:hypothetical protein
VDCGEGDGGPQDLTANGHGAAEPQPRPELAAKERTEHKDFTTDLMIGSKHGSNQNNTRYAHSWASRISQKAAKQAKN